MSTGSRFIRATAIVVLCVGGVSWASDGSARSQRKSKKAQAPPPLFAGPTGPVPQMPLDSIAAVPPQVEYRNGQLTIVAPNSTLSDILRAVKKQTGADIEIPSATDRVVTRLGPGPARDVMADLLNGSRFNYVLLGSPDDASILTRVVLVAKSGPETAPAAGAPQPAPARAMDEQPPPEEPAAEDASADQPEEPAPDENADQTAADAEQQQQQQGDQPGVKTPQQMLQEMQQRQMQLQQQQPLGQAPVPGSGMPPHPPQEP